MIPACKEQFYLEEMTNADSTYAVNAVQVLPGGDLILCGSTRFNSAGAGALTRVRTDGSVVWKKSYATPSGNEFYDITLLNDGNLAVSGPDGSLWKISTAGTLLWGRTYRYPTQESSRNTSISSDAQGNIYTIGFFVEDNLGFQDRIAFRKYDANGNLIYSKMVKGSGNMTLARPEDLRIVNGDAYVTGYLQNYYFYSAFLMKLNTATGNIGWTRLYNFNGADLDFLHIIPAPTGLLLTGRDGINGTDTAVLLQTDWNGIPLTANYIQHRSVREYEQFAIDKDGSVYYGAGVFDLTDLSTQAVFGKINLTSGIQWIKEYPIYSGIARMMSIDIQQGTLNYAGVAFPGTYTAYSFLGRLDLEGTAACNFKDYPATWGSANVSVRDTILFVYEKAMFEVIFSPAITDMNVDITQKCIVESTCDSLNILRDSIVFCLTSDTATIEFYKNPNCVLGITFNYDPFYIRQIATSANTVSFELLRPGTSKIYATIAGSCGELEDSVVIDYRPASVLTLGNDTSFCVGPVVIGTASNYTSYSWSTGDTTHTIRTNEPGTYTLAVTDACGNRQFDQINIFKTEPAVISLGPDLDICKGDSVQVFGPAGFQTYEWTSAVILQPLGVNGVWSAPSNNVVVSLTAITTDGCISRDTVKITTLDTPSNMLNPSYTFCSGNPQIVEAKDKYPKYKWSLGDTTSAIIPATPGVYTLQVTGTNGCVGQASTTVIFEDCYKAIAYPNAFTPNGDGVNDTYNPVIGMPLTMYQFTIYNRWGEIVFKTTDPHSGWDGFVNGKKQDSGNYTWKCLYQPVGKTLQIDKGRVILIR
jgi:gliding motility-associated-like protein